ncbi:MAG: hypothetical protein ACNYVW_05060 [Methanosarcinales archaeon]
MRIEFGTKTLKFLSKTSLRQQDPMLSDCFAWMTREIIDKYGLV